MAWRIEFRPAAARELKKLDRQVQQRIASFLNERLAPLDDPRSLAEPLSGPFAGFSRFRVGNYRLIVQFQDERLVVVVMRIDHRSRVYR